VDAKIPLNEFNRENNGNTRVGCDLRICQKLPCALVIRRENQKGSLLPLNMLSKHEEFSNFVSLGRC
jgi:hypothetical protein